MEAIGAGVGVLTLITFALQSTKKIYETVSSIKNGPQQVGQLTSAVRNLQLVLTQLLNCRAIQIADSETDLEIISNLISECRVDLARYEKELEEIRICPDDRATGKAWKKFKTVLRQKDFQWMCVAVNHHFNELNCQLNIIQS